MPLYDVNIKLWKANNLPVGDVVSSDPYIKIVVDQTSVSTKTRPLFCTLNPVWDEDWRLINVPLKTIFRVDVWDYDTLNKDDLLGFCEYVFDNKDGEVVLNLKRNNKACGTVTIVVTSKEVSHGDGADAIPQTLAWSGPVRYHSHRSGFAGLLASLKTDEGLLYSTYEVRLPHVMTTFANAKQGWNRAYPNAQKIFGQGAASLLVRQVIAKQHHGLYQHAKDSQYGVITNGLEFLQLFKFGKRGSKSRMYTYVLLEDCIRFSETGAAFFTDFMSKHAMHANCSEEVIFAGEFHVEELDDGSWRFVIDNNSGTYAPDKTKLPSLCQLFTNTFPDIKVAALDRDDAELKVWREKHI